MKLVKEVALNLDIMLVLARCVVVMVKLGQARGFLQFNRLVRNAQDQVKKSLTRVLVVEVKVRNNPQKGCL